MKTKLFSAVIISCLVSSFSQSAIAPGGDAPFTFNTTGSLNNARDSHTATLLTKGRILVPGGVDSNGILASAELYDPVSGTWATTGALNTSRDSHTATLLANGNVLIAGGNLGSSPIAGAELYDPVSETWTPTGSLNTARDQQTATLLPNGKVSRCRRS